MLRACADRATIGSGPGTAGLSRLLRAYGVASLVIFPTLMVGILAQSHLLAEHGGKFNWTIWNDVRAGDQPAHVPPMLFTIYIVWAVFLLVAARNPAANGSFLAFTAWANLEPATVGRPPAHAFPRRSECTSESVGA